MILQFGLSSPLFSKLKRTAILIRNRIAHCSSVKPSKFRILNTLVVPILFRTPQLVFNTTLIQNSTEPHSQCGCSLEFRMSTRFQKNSLNLNSNYAFHFSVILLMFNLSLPGKINLRQHITGRPSLDQRNLATNTAARPLKNICLNKNMKNQRHIVLMISKVMHYLCSNRINSYLRYQLNSTPVPILLLSLISWSIFSIKLLRTVVQKVFIHRYLISKKLPLNSSSLLSSMRTRFSSLP